MCRYHSPTVPRISADRPKIALAVVWTIASLVA